MFSCKDQKKNNVRSIEYNVYEHVAVSHSFVKNILLNWVLTSELSTGLAEGQHTARTLVMAELVRSKPSCTRRMEKS